MARYLHLHVLQRHGQPLDRGLHQNKARRGDLRVCDPVMNARAQSRPGLGHLELFQPWQDQLTT